MPESELRRSVMPMRESPQARELRLTNERLATLVEVTSPVVGKKSLREVLATALERVCAALDMDACVVRTISRGELALVASWGVQAEALVERLPNSDGIALVLLRERRPLAINNVQTEDFTRELAAAAHGDARKFVFRAYAGVPLMVRRHLIGVLGVYKISESRSFSDVELNHLQILANHIAITIINHRLYLKLSNRHRALQRQTRERMLAEQQRAELELQLRHAQRMDALGMLAGGVAHDFNNTLTAILSYAEVLRKAAEENTLDTDLLRDAAAALYTAGTHGANLTRQLLAFSRRQPSNPIVLDARKALREWNGLLRRLVREDLELEVRADGPPCWVCIDPGLLEQVIVNLVVNARDATSAGGRILVECKDVPARTGVACTWGAHHESAVDDQHVCLCVTDHGVGMDEATQARIFEPFFTTKPGGRGTGLGLSTVYGIVRQSEGRIEVESQPGTGTVMRVLLPRAAEPDYVVARPAPVLPAPRQARVLLCEDDAAVRSVLRLALESDGHVVLEAEDGLAALKLAAQSTHVDLLVTDVVMPGMSGFALANRLRALFPQVRCVFVSGYLGEASADCQVGEDDRYLQKPFRRQELLDCVQAALPKI